jgi:uncharacterized protein
MKRIGLLSDTHGHIDEGIISSFVDCHEIWHAGDIGNLNVVEKLQGIAPLRAVFGNIDGQEIRIRFKEFLRFECEGLDVLITHIGGYPGKYSPAARAVLKSNPPKLFICGHSHILKVIPDKTLGLLHINPGACGKEGFHKIRTVVKFHVNEGKIQNLEVVELGLRGQIP